MFSLLLEGIYLIRMNISGGYPKSLPIIENADEEVKRRVTLFRTVFFFFLTVRFSFRSGHGFKFASYRLTISANWMK